jgi:hypothetical protein
MIRERAKLAVNIPFYLPVGTPESNLIGLAASNGNVYSAFEIPVQTYAIVFHGGWKERWRKSGADGKRNGRYPYQGLRRVPRAASWIIRVE